MTHLIKVTNHNNFTIKEYCEGEAYIFRKGDSVNVPIEAMKHIFGVDFPADDASCKTPEFLDRVFAGCARRFGWNSHKEDELAANRKKLDKIEFKPIVMNMVEMVATNEELAPPREQKPVTTAKNKFKPLETEEEEVA